MRQEIDTAAAWEPNVNIGRALAEADDPVGVAGDDRHHLGGYGRLHASARNIAAVPPVFQYCHIGFDGLRSTAIHADDDDKSAGNPVS